jgi:hypothetical protein
MAGQDKFRRTTAMTMMMATTHPATTAHKKNLNIWQLMTHLGSHTIAHKTIEYLNDIHGCDGFWCEEDVPSGPQGLHHNAKPVWFLKHKKCA